MGELKSEAGKSILIIIVLLASIAIFLEVTGGDDDVDVAQESVHQKILMGKWMGHAHVRGRGHGHGHGTGGPEV